MKFDTMSTAHRIARNLRWGHYSTPYKEHLRLGLKIAHMQSRQLTVEDLNWLMNNPTLKAHAFATIDLSLLRTLRKSDRFVMKREREIHLHIEHYVRPLTEKENNELIRLMIASEIKEGKRPKLD